MLILPFRPAVTKNLFSGTGLPASASSSYGIQRRSEAVARTPWTEAGICIDHKSGARLRRSGQATRLCFPRLTQAHSSATKSNDVDRSLIIDVREFVEHECLNLLRGAAAGAGSD